MSGVSELFLGAGRASHQGLGVFHQGLRRLQDVLPVVRECVILFLGVQSAWGERDGLVLKVRKVRCCVGFYSSIAGH